MNPYGVQLCIAEQIFKHRCSLGQGMHYAGREKILWGLVSDIVDGESHDMWIERVVSEKQSHRNHADVLCEEVEAAVAAVQVVSPASDVLISPCVLARMVAPVIDRTREESDSVLSLVSAAVAVASARLVYPQTECIIDDAYSLERGAAMTYVMHRFKETVASLIQQERRLSREIERL